MPAILMRYAAASWAVAKVAAVSKSRLVMACVLAMSGLHLVPAGRAGLGGVAPGIGADLDDLVSPAAVLGAQLVRAVLRLAVAHFVLGEGRGVALDVAQRGPMIKRLAMPGAEAVVGVTVFVSTEVGDALAGGGVWHVASPMGESTLGRRESL